MPSQSRAPSVHVSDHQIQALLTRYQCPTPMHVLRMRFLGAIASPRMEVSPIQLVTQAWGGELPEFASEADAEELFQALLGGWWNRLSEFQNSRSPFRLPRSEVKPKRQALLELAQTRSQELAGFVDGLFGSDEEMDMPEKAHEALNVLARIHSMFASTVALLEIEATPAEHRELIDLLRNFQKMTITADEEINRVIQSCKRARAQHIENLTFVNARRFTAGPEIGDEDEDEWIEEEDSGDDAVLTYSPLNQTLTRNGVTVEIHIYKGRGSDWILEVVDAAKNSHVWDEQFQTDQQAFDEAMRALDEEPLEFMEPTPESKLN
jgi:hypothetical protein